MQSAVHPAALDPGYVVYLAPSPYLPVKRGTDELLSHPPMVTNGTGMSPTQTDINNDAKKAKLDHSQGLKPSRVLHFRGVPSDAMECEIVQLGVPFGRMNNLVLAKKKNQALLEMADVNAAQTMVNYYTERPPQIRGRTVYIQFSNHEELKTQSSSGQVSLQSTNAQAALQTAHHLMTSIEEPKMVLRVIVENMLYPVTIDVLKQIFSRYGQVLKIVTFSKNSTFQALIQFADAVTAQTAKVSLDGQNIYNGCCSLRIDYSKLPNLNVRYNNDKSRDYTNPSLPSGDGNPPAGLQLESALGFGAAAAAAGHRFMLSDQTANHMNHGHHLGDQGLPFSAHSGLTNGGTPGVFASPFMAGIGPTALTAYGTSNVGGMLPYGTESPTNPMSASPLLTTAGLAGIPGMPFGLGMPAAAAVGAAGLRLPGQPTIGAVLLVSNLNEDKVTPDALFTLFGVYGDVIRVKIMFNKKDNALVQFADATQAQVALQHIDRLKVWGKQIKVAPSKHSVVQMPKEGQPDAGLTKDFQTSALHRFKKPGSKNHNNIFPPSGTLHLSNIPPTTTEEDLHDLFSQHGTVVAFKFFQKDRKMALIQMSTVEEAVHGLLGLHNHELDNASHLRVSFTKSVI